MNLRHIIKLGHIKDIMNLRHIKSIVNLRHINDFRGVIDIINTKTLT
jgi:hypothetical protein